MSTDSTGVTWRELVTFLEQQGCTFTGQRGSHINGRTAFGADIGTCDPNKPGYVSAKHLAEIGRVFGKNLHDTLVWMGRRPTGKSKLTNARAARPVKAAPERVKVASIDELSNRMSSRLNAIYRSGRCRAASYDARHALQNIADRLDHWHADHENGAA